VREFLPKELEKYMYVPEEGEEEDIEKLLRKAHANNFRKQAVAVTATGGGRGKPETGGGGGTVVGVLDDEEEDEEEDIGFDEDVFAQILEERK